MKKITALFTIILVTAIGLAGCGGGGSGGGGGGTSHGTLTGSVEPAGGAAALVRAASDSCEADTIMATDSTGATSTTAIADDCSFSLTLTTGKAYVISFLLNDQFVATLIFNSGIAGFSSQSLPFFPASGTINLGTITISGSVATAENEPLDQVDEDDDDISDLEDSDDDSDDIDDEDEEDCDLDGFSDDMDESDDDDEHCNGSSGEDGSARVLEVRPRNDSDDEAGEDEDRVDLDKEVKARLSCEIDRSSVTAATFSVADENGVEVPCLYTFSGTSSNGNTITCRHEADFNPDTAYTATIDGILCADTTPVTARSWSWLTELNDDDEGDAEDEFDQEDDDDDEGEEDDEDDEDDDEDDEDGEEEDEDD